VSKKGFADSIASISPDIVCLQEVRALEKDLNFETVLPSIASKYTTRVWNPALKKGYSGTMTMSTRLHESRLGLKAMECAEGRVLTTDLDFATLINVYTPNAGRELVRLEYRTSWDRAFKEYILEEQKRKPVIVCGDLNVAHHEIDLARPKANMGSAGFTDEERQGLRSILQEARLVDTFRHIHGDLPGQYTWWSNMGGARSKNIGWRIDYFLLDERLLPYLKEATIYPNVLGSDHCPVGISLDVR
jgi:exodeoxyribonuclease-3